MVNAAGKSLETETAEKLFVELASPGLPEYKYVLDAFARHGNWTRARYWYDQAMQAGIPVNLDKEILLTMMFAAARSGNTVAAEQQMQEARAAGMEDHGGMYTALITAAAQSQDYELAEKWLQEARKAGLTQPEQYNSAIHAASRCGQLDSAEHVAALAELDGVALSSYSFSGLIVAAGSTNNMAAAERWFQRAIDSGGLSTALINAAVHQAARYNNLTAAEGFFRHFETSTLEPDACSFLGIIRAASHAGNLAAAEHRMEEALAAGHTQLPNLHLGPAGSKLLDFVCVIETNR